MRSTLIEHTDAVHAIAFSPDGKTLASASQDTTVKLWEVASGKCRVTNEVHAPVHAVAFGPDGTTLTWAGMNNCVTVHQIATGKQTITFHDDPLGIGCLAISKDGKHLASGSSGKSVVLWKLDGIDLTQEIELENSQKKIQAVAFSPDSKLLAYAPWSARSVELWDMAKGKKLKSLEGHAREMGAVAFSPDGKFLASGATDWTIRIWDLATGETVQKIVTGQIWVGTLAFSPDGKMLASGGHMKGKSRPGYMPPGAVELWNVELGTLIAARDHLRGVTGVSISPDGKTLASCSLDGVIKLWNMPESTDECGILSRP